MLIYRGEDCFQVPSEYCNSYLCISMYFFAFVISVAHYLNKFVMNSVGVRHNMSMSFT